MKCKYSTLASKQIDDPAWRLHNRTSGNNLTYELVKLSCTPTSHNTDNVCGSFASASITNSYSASCYYIQTFEGVNGSSIWVQIYHVCLPYKPLYSDPQLTVLLHLPDAAEAERLVRRNGLQLVYASKCSFVVVH